MRAWHTLHISFVHIFQYISEHILGDKYIYFNLSLSIYIYISLVAKKHTYIYACTLCAKARVPLIMCVCTRSMIPKP